MCQPQLDLAQQQLGAVQGRHCMTQLFDVLLTGPLLQGMNPVNQKEIDEKMKELDGTPNKGKLGANAILAVSIAVCKVCGAPGQGHAPVHAGPSRSIAVL